MPLGREHGIWYTFLEEALRSIEEDEGLKKIWNTMKGEIAAPPLIAKIAELVLGPHSRSSCSCVSRHCWAARRSAAPLPNITAATCASRSEM